MGRSGIAAVTVLWAASLFAGPAAAQNLDAVARRLATLETQANDIERLVRPPAGPPQGDAEAIERKLIQAQVAYGVGRFSDAALLLYDIVEKYPSSRSYPEALFYLADSLFGKGDNQLARGYFHRIVDAGGPTAPHYQQALERLIEISLRTQDTTRVTDYLAKLDAIAVGKKSDSVPYVRGKYAYFSGGHDEALRWFATIGNDSEYAFQARYFSGVAQVAKGDLGEAARTLHALIRATPKNENDERIVELAHLALGRVHYERDQPNDAIDHYLFINRRSEFFDDALFEVAWVYVKARQFDKALRALELLALANPQSARLPDVRILEGNLRIRKAQNEAVAQGNSAEEYAKASQVFESTRDTYEKPRAELEKILAMRADPRVFFNQITGKAGDALEVQVVLPEVVVSWLREEQEVARATGVSRDLDDIKASLEETQALIARLERAVSSPSRVAIFPLFAEQRSRAQEIEAGALKARQELTDAQRGLIERFATPAERTTLGELQGRRRAASAKLTKLPGSGDTYLERVRKARAAYIETDKRAQQVEVTIISLEAQMVALDKFYADMQAASGSGDTRTIPEEAYQAQMHELQGLVAQLRKELEAIRAEIVLASDEAGISDALTAEEQQAREELAAAVVAENQAMQPVVARMGGAERAQADRIAGLLGQADRVDGTTRKIVGRIEEYVDAQLSEAKTIIVEEKGNLVGYQQQLLAYGGETVDVGGEVVGGSFEAVSKKFYEIGVRADVGLLDVSWAQKESSQGTVDKLRHDFSREKNAIESDLKMIKEEAETPTPPAAAKEAGSE